MSITIKKVSFGNTKPPFVLQNNWNLSASAMSQPNQSPPNTAAAVPVPAVVNTQPQTAANVAPVPVSQTTHNNLSADKVLAYVSSGLALAALGVTTVSSVRGRNAQKTAESMERLEQRLSTLISDKVAGLDQKVQGSITSIDNKITKEVEERVGLGRYHDGIIGDMKKWLSEVQKLAQEKASTIVVGKGTNFIAKEVEINGSKMNLATIMHGYGVETELLQSKLRAEAAQRMFGLVDRSNMSIPDVPVVRVPTSEFKGIASTGGLSVVPKEVIANLGAFINSKQQSRLIVDMPMYLGEVANNLSSGQQTFHALEAIGNGRYNVVSKAINQGDSDKVVLRNLEKIADMEVPVYDDVARTIQNVEVYMAKGLTQQVDYNLLRKYLSPEDLAAYNSKIHHYEHNEVKGVQKKLKPLRKTLSEAKQQEANIIKNSPFKQTLEDIAELGKTIKNLEAEHVNLINGNNTDNIIKAYKDALAKEGKEANRLNVILKIEELHTEALRQKAKMDSDYARALDKFEADNPEFKAVRDKIKETSLSIKSITEEFAKNQGQIYSKGLLRVSGDVDGHVKAEIVFDGVFYKNEKFDMKGPRLESSKDKNIYNNNTINSGETERFSYFNKYFYEFLIRSKESTNDRLGADLIIGNDWHTGGISAMTRLLTRAKEAVGDLTPEAAEKIYNTPIVTILHNAQEAGRSGHSNAKLFNILFGEHSAMIAENANMPDVYKVVYNAAIKAKLSPEEAAKRASEAAKDVGLPSKCWNGLMHSGAVDPQAMAASYSDVIVPVSDKYMEEIATQGVYGRENFELFRLRKYASEHAGWFNNQSTMVGITNGCDKVNNILTEEGARLLESQLNLKKNSLKVYDGSTSVLDWHNHNKNVILEQVKKDILDKANPMAISHPELTDLTGVNENTMVVATAGRIVDQKGLDIFAGAIEDILRNHKFPDGNYPVFYAQGKGGEEFVKMLLAVKEKVAKSPELGGEAAAKRIVFANLFSEPGRYDACKLMSDFSIMSSWFEPCGLVHKEIVAKSGAIPIVNETGGLTSGLTNGVDAIFSKFKPAEPNKDAVRGQNISNFSNAMWDAFTVFSDKAKFAKMMENSYNNDFSWLVENGPMAQYVKIFTDLKVLKPQILGEAA